MVSPNSGDFAIGQTVTRHGHSTAQGKPYSGGTLGRGEYASGDDRPFSDIRRNINDVWRMLALHRWMFFVPVCLASSGAFIASLYYPRLYKAVTSFERRNDPVMMNLPMSAGAASFRYFRNTMVRDLTSVECVSEAIAGKGFFDDLQRDESGQLTPESHSRCDNLARSLVGTLSITTASPSELIDIIRITYTGPDPEVGKKLVDQVKKTYIRRTMAWILDFLVSQRDYFLQEAEEAAQELQAAKRDDTLLRLENPYLNPGDPGAIALKLSQLELERRELLLRRREYESELSAQRQLLATTTPGFMSGADGADPVVPVLLSPEAMRLQQQIQEIDRKLRELRETRGMTDKHPEILELRGSRRAFGDALENELTELAALTGPNGSMAAGFQSAGPSRTVSTASMVLVDDPRNGDRTRLRVQISAQQAKIKEVEISFTTNQQETDQLRRAKEDLFSKQEEFSQITSRVQQARQKHNQFQSTLAQIEPAIKAIHQDRLLQFSEGQPAGATSRPVSPKAATVLLLALLAGLAAGVAFVLVGELTDNIFRGSSQVARSLGLPILEAIDEIVTGQDRRRLLVRRAVVTPLVVTACLALSGLTGSMAYLSITQPWTYQKIRKIPQAALELFVETEESEGS